jgi:prepilin-type N-terminal cleavage/methylation domain-containing protein
MHPRTGRTGFTMIELLVVMTVIAILLGLFLPAAQRSHVNAGRTQTINNLRQVAIAAHGSHDTFKRFPPSAGTWQGKTGTLHYYLLPFIEGGNLYNLVPGQGSSHDIRANVFQPYLSPSDPTSTDGKTTAGSGATNFIANNLAFPHSGGRMPGTYVQGTSNCVFFVTARANCAGGLSNAWAELGNNSPILSGLGAGPPSSPPQGFDDVQFTKGMGHALEPRGALVAMGDASARSVSPALSLATWRSVTDPAAVAPPGGDWQE